MNKPVKIAFTGSLILNVLFLGLAAGEVFHEGFHHEPRDHKPWEKAKKELSPETRAVIKATFKGKKEAIVPLFKDAHKKKEIMKKIISAPELNVEAYDAMAAELIELNSDLMEHRISAVKEIFSQLPQEERAKMADFTVEKMLGKPPKPPKFDKKRRGNSREKGRFDSENMRKHGAIESEHGRMPFDGREHMERRPNHED